MKRIILSTLALALISTGFAQTPPTVVPGQMTPSAPTVTQNPAFVQFIVKEHDFGNIKQGVPASFVFEMKNVGDRNIELLNVGASCGCTTPNWRGGVYKPGETTNITATFDARSEGIFHKVITVTTSEGVETLIIKGNVLNVQAYDQWKAQQMTADSIKKAAEAKSNPAKKSKNKKAKKSKDNSSEKKDNSSAISNFNDKKRK